MGGVPKVGSVECVLEITCAGELCVVIISCRNMLWVFVDFVDCKIGFVVSANLVDSVLELESLTV